ALWTAESSALAAEQYMVRRRFGAIRSRATQPRCRIRPSFCRSHNQRLRAGKLDQNYLRDQPERVRPIRLSHCPSGRSVKLRLLLLGMCGSGELLEPQFILSFCDQVKLIGGDIAESLGLTTWPFDLHGLGDVRLP